jgi:hypothetical protein
MLSRFDNNLLNNDHLHSSIRQRIALDILELDYAKTVVSDVLKLRLQLRNKSRNFSLIPVDFALPYESSTNLTTDTKYGTIKQNNSTGQPVHNFDDLLAIWNQAFNSSPSDNDSNKPT